MKRLHYIANLLRFALRHNPLLLAGVGISLVSVAIELLAMSSLMPLFELVSGREHSRDAIIPRMIEAIGFEATATALLWAFVVLFALRILTQLVGQSLSTYLSKLVMAQLGSLAFNQIVRRVALREVTDKSIGFYITLAGDEAFRASTLVMSMTQFFSTATLALFYFAAVVAYSPLTGGLVVLFLLCSAIPYLIAMRASHKLGGRQTEQSRRAHSIFLDALNNLKAVRAFSAESYVVGLYRPTIFQYARTLFLNEFIALAIKLVPVLVLLFMFGGWLLLADTPLQSVGIAFVVTMIIYLMRFFPVVGQCVMLSMKIAADAKAGKDVTTLLATDQEESGSPSCGDLGAIATIDLDKVEFAYDPAKKILNGLDVRFERGKSYAITGRSGVGKSTLLDLLLRFHQPTAGLLALNAIPVAQIGDAEIRRRVILVSQEPAIFDDTVINNICMGMEAPLAQVHEACESACIHDDILAMEHGYETRLRYQGRNLSGGQRQRIALARAMLRSSEVLILDEATSALDKPTQARVMRNILSRYADRIVIVVTHDPAILEMVDSVIDLGAVSDGAVRDPVDRMHLL